jgi:hypothetical protein
MFSRLRVLWRARGTRPRANAHPIESTTPVEHVSVVRVEPSAAAKGGPTAVRGRQKLVVLGMMTRHPVAGIVWLTMQYMVGLARLGYDVYYVEAHGGTPKMFMRDGDEDGSRGAASFLDSVFKRFDLADRWAFQAFHSDGQYYGLSETRVKALYDEAALIFNLHGGTTPRPEHVRTNRLVYLGTDPVEREIALHQNDKEIHDLFAAHAVFFTWGENYGNPDCAVPVSHEFHLMPTRQPVVMDFWQPNGTPPGDLFTTVGSWRQLWREVNLNGEKYAWSKHHEFLKFVDLPSRTDQRFELALAGCDGEDRALLERHGWQVRDGLTISADMDDYRQYVFRSRGEFTVAKDQNVRLRSGWFSDRSATYLASGRPVITQDTGFGNILPTGEGLFGFNDVASAVDALERINADHPRHSRAARAIAREHFDHERVLTKLLADIGI